ncbi:YkgJ family cysteine cluster protein [Thioclava sp. BHET1]|nr:YkgJ family cysteine cluster protein [Thioclava sp. BHET1]
MGGDLALAKGMGHVENRVLLLAQCEIHSSPPSGPGATVLLPSGADDFPASRLLRGGVKAVSAHRRRSCSRRPAPGYPKLTTQELDCISCGACCFGGHDRYILLLPEDASRPIPDHAIHEVEGKRYMRMSEGHCAQLTLSDAGKLVCAIYDHRPTACRAFRSGSFECSMARRHRGAEAAALRDRALPPRAEIILPADLPLVPGMPDPSGELPPGAQA